MSERKTIYRSRPLRGTLDPSGIVSLLTRDGALTTMAVATRFGWSVEDARRLLARLQRKGELQSRLESGWGSQHRVWSVAHAL